MANTRSDNMNLAAKGCLGAAGICGVIGIFVPPVLIPAAALTVAGGAIEVVDAIMTKVESAKTEKEAKYQVAEKKSGRDSKAVEFASQVLNPDARKDNVAGLKKRAEPVQKVNDR